MNTLEIAARDALLTLALYWTIAMYREKSYIFLDSKSKWTICL